jgi:hypothetical protein
MALLLASSGCVEIGRIKERWSCFWRTSRTPENAMAWEVGARLAQTRRSKKHVKKWKDVREAKPSAVEGLVPEMCRGWP